MSSRYPVPFPSVEQSLEAIENQLIGINDQLSTLNELIEQMIMVMAQGE